MHNFVTSFFNELEKIAAPQNNGGGMVATSPVQLENQELTEQINNIQLKLQLRQMMQAASAMQAADQQAPQAPPQPQMPRQRSQGMPVDPTEMSGEENV